MVTAARRLGETPTLGERVEVLERLVREQAATIALLAARVEADDQVDGAVPSALPSSWRPIKAAAPEVGFSESGLRKRIDRAKLVEGERPWWRYRAARLWIDVDRCPRRKVRT